MGPGQGDGERRRRAPPREPPWVLCLEGIYLVISEEDPNRIFIIFPGVSFQNHGFQ